MKKVMCILALGVLSLATYITVPNTIYQGSHTLVDPKKLDQNFSAITSGLSAGVLDINVYRMYINGVLALDQNRNMNVGALTVTGNLNVTSATTFSTLNVTSLTATNLTAASGTLNLNALYTPYIRSQAGSVGAMVNGQTLTILGQNGGSTASGGGIIVQSGEAGVGSAGDITLNAGTIVSYPTAGLGRIVMSAQKYNLTTPSQPSSGGFNYTNNAGQNDAFTLNNSNLVLNGAFCLSHQVVSPNTTASINFSCVIPQLVINTATTLNALTVNITQQYNQGAAVAIADGTILGISTTQPITTFNVQSVGNTMYNRPTTLTAGQFMRFIYDLATLSWFRIE